jgi:predicted nucleic acid-binding protein
MIILDTNVISEAMRDSPNAMVALWLHSQPSSELATTAINVAELKYGFARLEPGRRRGELEARFDSLVRRGFASSYAADLRAAFSILTLPRRMCLPNLPRCASVSVDHSRASMGS